MSKAHSTKPYRCDNLPDHNRGAWHYRENGGITVCIPSGDGSVLIARIPSRSLRAWAKVDNARRKGKK